MKFFILVLFLAIPFLSNAQSPISELKNIIQNDDVEAFNKFIKAGNDINECYEVKGSSYNILALSIKLESKNVFNKCLELKPNLDQICEDKTPLIYAIKYDKMEMFEALLEKGADKNATTKKGKTAHDYAMKYNRSNFISKLRYHIFRN